MAILPSDFSMCLGDTVSLDAYYISGTHYWQGNSSNATFQVTDVGVYTLSETVCNTSDTVEIFSGSISVNLGNDTLISQSQKVVSNTVMLGILLCSVKPIEVA